MDHGHMVQIQILAFWVGRKQIFHAARLARRQISFYICGNYLMGLIFLPGV